MTQLLDASSLLLLIKNKGPKAAEILKGNSTIPLVFYELGNVLRTNVAIHKNITPTEAYEALANIHQGLELVTKIRQDNQEDCQKILQNSIMYNITYYDSAYLTAAQKLNQTLVTEDKQLRGAAQKANIPTTQSDKL